MLEHFNERKENGGYYMSKFMFKKSRDIIYMMISDEFATPTLIIFWKSNMIFQ